MEPNQSVADPQSETVSSNHSRHTGLWTGMSIVGALIIVIGIGTYVVSKQMSQKNKLPAPVLLQNKPLSNRPIATKLPQKEALTERISPSPMIPPTSTPIPEQDKPSTLSSPTKVLTSDGKNYFYYGYPTGQNNMSPKKIIFSLPGHGSTAEQDYAAWKPQLVEHGGYALGSLNWWDGKGEAPTNYLSPAVVASEIALFLTKQGYSKSDIVLLEGFSRGSANTYAVVGNDRLSGLSVIDGVISASGKYQSDFAMTEQILTLNGGKPYANIPWILVCGDKDDNPTRDGCIGMRETETFLSGKGAKILGFLSDPNGGHGSFHMSSLKLALQALKLFDTTFTQ